MLCPQCVQRIHRGAESCPHCGYTLVQADDLFGCGAGELPCLADTAGLLRQRERDLVGAAMENFRRRFPQLFTVVFSGRLENAELLRPFGFWLLNRAVFRDRTEQGNAGCILLIIDPESKSAGLSFGYLLDAYLDEASTFDSLAAAHADWIEGNYADGIVRLHSRLAAILAKKARRARRRPERFARRVAPPRKKAAAAPEKAGDEARPES